MASAHYKTLLGILAAVVIVQSSALYICRKQASARSPITETPILRLPGVAFQPDGDQYDVVVWSRTKLSTGAFDAEDLRQVRIEIRDESETFRFEWPLGAHCAPENAELRDLAGNGNTVFVLACDGVRVVQFTERDFVFRMEQDAIDSALAPSRLVDLDHDGRVEYIAALNYPQRFGEPNNLMTLPLPVIYRWSPENGFEEVSSEFPDVYRTRLIPELHKLQEEEQDVSRRVLFDAAIVYIEQRVLASSPENLVPTLE